MKRRRSILPIVAAALVLAGLVYAFLPRPLEVEVATIGRQPIVVTVDEEGRTRVIERYVLSAPVSGLLARIDARPGARVAAGEVVAQVRPSAPTPLDARTAAQWEARESAAVASLQEATARVARANASLTLARREEERRRALVAAAAAAQRELDEAISARETAEAEQRAAEAAVRVAEYSRDEARAILAHAASRGSRGDIVPVRAPHEGVLLRVFEENERVVAAGTPLVELGDPTTLEIVVDLLSTDAVKVGPGARVIIDRWGGDRPLAGRVRLIEPSSFTKVSALGVEEQRVNVIVDLTSPPADRERLGDRFAVEARIVLDERPSALVAPTSALVRTGEAWAVFAVDDGGHARLRPVKVGLRNGLDAEILEGIQDGATVIVHPGDEVRDGTSVAPRTAA